MSTSWGNSSGFGGNSAFGGASQPTTFGSATSNSPFGQKPPQPSGLSLNTSGGLFGGNTGGTLGQNQQAPSLGGLFGNSGANSATNKPGGLFGNTTSNNTTTNTGGGLFGSANNTSGATSNTGGLFGNSNPSGNANTGGLFGNSNTTSNSGGLFGNSGTNASANTGGLFGNSGSNTNTGGLFGNSGSAATNNNAATGGLFGSSGTTASNTNNAATGGLFGNKPATGGLFGNSSTGQLGGLSNKPATGGLGTSGGLFGGSNTNAQSGGLFGNSSNTQSSGLFGGAGASNTGGLFGNSTNNALNNPTGGLFGQLNAASGISGAGATIANTNPYNSDSILSTINKTEMVMPLSITGSLFAKSGTAKSKESLNRTNLVKKNAKSSLFTKLAQTFNIFRATTETPSLDLGVSKLRGIFSQLNYLKDEPVINKANYSVNKPRTVTHKITLPLDYRESDVKKLVIRSKPLKFHLINADKVFNAKRRRVLTLALPSGQNNHSLTDDEESDVELIESTEARDKHIAEDIPKKLLPPEVVEQVNLDNVEDNDGYWCSPTLLDLITLNDQELSQVENFIIGRHDVGQIAYNYPVDLSSIFARCEQENSSVARELFGKIVKMEGSIVRVYDEVELQQVKPAIGFELNVPATITLKTPPKRNISKQEHIRRLQNLTGMEFVTFDPLTDNWTFKVKHFSVWGLIDDSEDEDEEDVELKRLRELKKQQDRLEGEASVIYSRIYENDEYKQELKRQKIGGSTRGLPGGWDYDTTTQSGGALGFKQKLVHDEINRLVNLFKQDKSVDAIAANASDITIESDSEDVRSPNSLPLEGPLYPEEIKSYDYLKQIVSVLPPNTDLNELVDEKAYEPDVEDDAVFDNFNRQPALATSKDWLLQLELANDIDSALTPYLTIPRTKQLSLKAVNDILFSDFDRSSVDSNQISTPIKESHPQASPNISHAAIDISSVSKLVQNLLLKANLKKRTNDYPEFHLDGSLSFKDIASISKTETDTKVLKLASILFDKVDLSTYKKYDKVDFSNSALVLRLKTLEQRRAFSSWLKEYSQPATSKSGDLLELIRDYVIFGKLKPAIDLAITSHNSHLASCLTLIDSNDDAVKKIAQNQLESWESNKTIGLIPSPLVTIFKILAGKLSEVALKLSFEESVGLHAFYTDPSERLEKILKDISLNGSTGGLADLIKVFLSLKSEGYNSSIKELARSNLSEQVKWLVLCLLTRHYNDDQYSDAGDSICQRFGTALAANGLWKEAIFVAACLSNDKDAEKLIKDLVIKEVAHIKGGEVDEEEYLVTVLGVPRSLIYQALAIEKAKKKDFWGQGLALVQAQLWEEAHEVICIHLGPATVIDNDSDLKLQLRALITSFPDQGGIIPKWNQGAGLYALYFDVVEAFEEQEAVSGDDLTFLLNNLALISDYNSFTVKAAIRIMLKRIGDIALENKQKVSELRKKILALKLGENERNYFENRLLSVGL